MGASTSTFPPVLLASFLPHPLHVTSLVEAENMGLSSPQSGHLTSRKLLLGFGMNSRSLFISLLHYLRLSQAYAFAHHLLVAFLTFQLEGRLLGSFRRPNQLRELLASVPAFSTGLSSGTPGGSPLFPLLVKRDGMKGMVLARWTECPQFLRDFHGVFRRADPSCDLCVVV